MDLLSAIPYHGFYWHENVSGQGDSWTDHLIDFETDEWPSITVSGDCDNDGDLDLLTYGWTSYDGSTGKVVWHENIDGQGHFNSEHLILNLRCRFVKAIDFDLDNDIDLVCIDILVRKYRWSGQF